MAGNQPTQKAKRSIWVYAIPIGIILAFLALLVSTSNSIPDLAMHFITNAIIWSLVAAAVIWIVRKITGR